MKTEQSLVLGIEKGACSKTSLGRSNRRAMTMAKALYSTKDLLSIAAAVVNVVSPALSFPSLYLALPALLFAFDWPLDYPALFVDMVAVNESAIDANTWKSVSLDHSSLDIRFLVPDTPNWSRVRGK